MIKQRYLLFFLLAGFISFSFSASVHAAEEVVLIYSIFRKPIAVADLRQLADTGKPSFTLNAFLRLANQSPESLQQTLNKTVSVDSVIFPTVLNSFVGDTLLNQVSEVIHPSSPQKGKDALRQALLDSAKVDNQIQVIEVIEKYPNRKIYVEGERLLELYSQIKGVMDKLPRLPL